MTSPEFNEKHAHEVAKQTLYGNFVPQVKTYEKCPEKHQNTMIRAFLDAAKKAE